MVRVHGTWCMVRVHGTWYGYMVQVRGAWYMGKGTWYMAHGTWYGAFGTVTLYWLHSCPLNNICSFTMFPARRLNYLSSGLPTKKAVSSKRVQDATLLPWKYRFPLVLWTARQVVGCRGTVPKPAAETPLEAEVGRVFDSLWWRRRF